MIRRQLIIVGVDRLAKVVFLWMGIGNKDALDVFGDLNFQPGDYVFVCKPHELHGSRKMLRGIFNIKSDNTKI